VPKKQDESESAGPLANGGVGGAVPDPDAPQENTESTPADKPAESGEPTTPATADSQQTNGAAKPAVAEPVAAAEKSTEPAPATTETPGANGDAKPTEDVDMEDSAPVTGAGATEEEEGSTANSKKRDAETALGPDANAEGDAAGGKKAKMAVDTGATLAAKPEDAKPEAKSPSTAETNGGGAGNGAGAGAKPADAAATAAPPAPAAAPAPPAKKGGRPKKQAGKVAAAAAALVGRTARKTRSQGPVEL
jgi:hypothetical protein